MRRILLHWTAAGFLLALLCLAAWLATRTHATAELGNPFAWWADFLRPESHPLHAAVWIVSHPGDWWARLLGQELDFAVTAVGVLVVVLGLRWVGRR